MIHYTCDCCKRILDPEVDARYVVNIEAYAELDPLMDDEHADDRDHLAEIQEILEQVENGDSVEYEAPTFQKRRFDLCAECFKDFIKNPVGRETTARIGFSDN